MQRNKDSVLVTGDVSARPGWDRRMFVGGMTAAAAALTLVRCGDDDEEPRAQSVNIDMADDTGVLNYAYALEQLEAAFYRQVLTTRYTGMTADEASVLADIRDHEIAHAAFLKAALGSAAIADLSVNFSAIDFTSKTSVLTTARTFEDLGVGAYNGAGQRLVSADLLTIAGKIVSVEARHAAAIRDLINPFSVDGTGEGTPNVIDANGLDQALNPRDVLAAAGAFIATQVTLTNV